MNSPNKCLHLDETGMNSPNKCLHLSGTGMYISYISLYIPIYAPIYPPELRYDIASPYCGSEHRDMHPHEDPFPFWGGVWGAEPLSLRGEALSPSLGGCEAFPLRICWGDEVRVFTLPAEGPRTHGAQSPLGFFKQTYFFP